jgi:hypothetical protein
LPTENCNRPLSHNEDQWGHWLGGKFTPCDKTHNRSYRIYRSKYYGRGKHEDITVVTGLSWADAQARRQQMQADEDKLHPERSSWTKDLFIIELE